jgi:hypothetical protein
VPSPRGEDAAVAVYCRCMVGEGAGYSCAVLVLEAKGLAQQSGP